MKAIEIGIIGGTRGMGKWFADLLTDQGYSVHGSGRTSGLTIPAMAEQCDVVVVSVPIGVTADIIKAVGPLMREDALLMDLTSVKEGPVQLMVEHSASEVIGCHPLFGPQMETKGQNVVLCPAKGNKWLPWLKKVFQDAGALIVEADPQKHDEMMAVVQGLNHFNNLMMGFAMGRLRENLSGLDNFTTPVFRTKVEQVKKVFCENPGLYAEIIIENPHKDRVINVYKEIFLQLERLIQNKNAPALTARMEESASQIFPEEEA
ncbi:MAG: prephenate dehydrogenase/arogenate dehydrogenase family protein [Deltaproteobacteria bacterium]|nr:prephenate dehydrogenase/arogenate dehydrogenase family protein [Deltaproteobacteria bacterium]